MKELYRKENYVIAIYDDSNYVVYDHTKPKVNKKTGKTTYDFMWFGNIPQAIREVSRLLANGACHDLVSWCKCNDDYHTELETLILGAARP